MSNAAKKVQAPGMTALLTVSVTEESGILAARQRAKQLARLLGFEQQDQIRFATATSEIARNAVQYGEDGRVEFFANLSDPLQLLVRVSDKGLGIPECDKVLEGRFHSEAGLGLGLSGTRRLMESFSVESSPGNGTVVTFGKGLPRGTRRVEAQQISQLIDQLTVEQISPAAEMRQQNQELLVALDLIRKQEGDLERRHADKTRLEQELEETNRGVVALYAELDERATALRRANDVKTRFLSYMSHEFRTPLNATLALANLLLQRIDGDLTEEQERQIKFIREASGELLEMVNDLLDLAKVESGKADPRLDRVEISRVFSALRGMMRPLTQNDQVNLIFEDAPAGLSIISDEGKINQILRNLISNALKFTERGEVRVSVNSEGDQLIFAVTDTGIGIALEDQEGIFREFEQIESPVQKKVRGTGLGLPLSRKLAELLGGTLSVLSAVGQGSTFRLTLPLFKQEEQVESTHSSVSAAGDTILVIDDEEVSRYLVHQMLRGTSYLITEARGGYEGVEKARFDQPSLILLDISMPDRNGFEVLEDLKSDPATENIPVIFHTSRTFTAADLERTRGRHAGILAKQSDNQQEALAMIRKALSTVSVRLNSDARL